MPLQNRVLPTGEIVADPARGTLMGNRGGALHRADRSLGAARWRSKAWICCRLDFRNRRRTVMTPGRYTELFFLDEAVALAAGHRPCAECRRADYLAFLDAYAETAGGRPRAPDLDAALHASRLDGARQRRFRAPANRVPPGAFVALGPTPHLRDDGALLPFTPEGYGPPVPLPTATLEVLTPRLTCAILAAGYRPALHPSLVRPAP